MTHDVQSNKEYWEKFYQKNVLSVPSQFCAMVATEADRNNAIVEFGCGNGRDSIYFASQKFEVYGTDLSHEAIKFCENTAAKTGLTNAKFYQGDLSNLEDIHNIVQRARKANGNNRIAGYSRFVMHSIDDTQQADFLRNIANELHSGEKFYFEFRSKEDADLMKVFGNHFRRFVDTEAFNKAMTDIHGFDLLYSRTGRGMAKYKDEDPFVSRLIFEKR